MHKGGDRQILYVDYDVPESHHITEEARHHIQDWLSPRNEVAYFQDNHSCGSCESCSRIFSFDLAQISPSVMVLHIHLENGQRVYFNDNGEALQAVER